MNLCKKKNTLAFDSFRMFTWAWVIPWLILIYFSSTAEPLRPLYLLYHAGGV